MTDVQSCLQIRSNTLIAYRKFPRTFRNLVAQKQLTENLKLQKTYTGLCTPGSRKRIIRCIEFLVQAAYEKKRWVTNPVTQQPMPFNLSFQTLTVHSPDKNILTKEAYKNLLAPYLKWMRDNYGCYTYMWKAELQERGQIHYHIISTAFIHYEDVRKKWNYLNRKAGYLDDFFKEYGHYNAPGTEIKSVEKQHEMAGYLKKEFLKSYQNKTTVGGKVWDCSMNLKEVKPFTVNHDGYRGLISAMIFRNEIKEQFSDSRCTIYKMTNEKAKAKDILNYYDSKAYKEFLHKIYSVDVEAKQVIIKKPAPEINFDVPDITLTPGQKSIFGLYNNAWVDFKIKINYFSSS